MLVASIEDDNKAKMAKYIKQGQDQYLAALHFEGLNNVVYYELKQEVHNRWIVHGTGTTPKLVKHTLQMCNKYQQEGRSFQARVKVKNKDGVACVQSKVNSNQILIKEGGFVEVLPLRSKPPPQRLTRHHCGKEEGDTRCQE